MTNPLCRFVGVNQCSLCAKRAPRFCRIFHLHGLHCCTWPPPTARPEAPQRCGARLSVPGTFLDPLSRLRLVVHCHASELYRPGNAPASRFALELDCPVVIGAGPARPSLPREPRYACCPSLNRTTMRCFFNWRLATRTSPHGGVSVIRGVAHCAASGAEPVLIELAGPSRGVPSQPGP